MSLKSIHRALPRSIFAVALITTSTIHTQSAQAGWFWPLLFGTAARGAATTVARAAATTAVRRAAIGAATVGATAGYAAANASEESFEGVKVADTNEYSTATLKTQYCVPANRQSIYILPRSANRCLDGMSPITKIHDLSEILD